MTQSSFKKSDEWIARRLKSIGGSDISAITGRSTFKTSYELFLEKTGKIVPPDLSSLPHIIRGHLSEEIARERIERETLTAYRPKFWQHPTCEFMTASDDGFSHELNQTLEIKALGKEKHKEVKAGIIPPMYMDQMQWGLMISGCVKCIFISYRVEEDEMLTIDVFPDKKYQDELMAAGMNFWLNNVLKDKAPELGDGDYVEVKNERLEALTKEYEALYKKSKMDEARIAEITEELKPYTATQRAIRCGEIKLLRSERMGSIDYKKYLEDSNISSVDMEKYRRKPTESFRVFLPSLDLTQI